MEDKKIKPQTYKDWRRLYNTWLRVLGAEYCSCMDNRWPHRKPMLFREMQMIRYRCERIHKRMEVERDAMTHSHLEAIVEMVTGKH